MKRFLLAIGATAMWVTVARPAEIEKLDIPGQPIVFVSIKGEITDGDGGRFVEVVDGHDRVSVILQSPGGLVKEALEIGAEIRSRNFATMVLPEGDCFSACGLIWVSGARRYMSQSSNIGFHAAYRVENGEYRESGVANAEIGSFLTHLGLRIEAIRFFTIAGPNEFLLLTPERARGLGVDVFEQNGFEVTTPAQAPSADIHADRFVSYTFLLSRCTNLFHLEKADIDAGIRAAFDEGNRLVGPEKWVELWIPMLDRVKSEIGSKGALTLCLETEANVRKQGLPTGINGPSFECSAASSPTESALCSNEALWAKDRATSAIYFYIHSYQDAALRKKVLANQRDWLKLRNECGANKTCLTQIYDQRLSLFWDIDLAE